LGVDRQALGEVLFDPTEERAKIYVFRIRCDAVRGELCLGAEPVVIEGLMAGPLRVPRYPSRAPTERRCRVDVGSDDQP